MMELENRKAKRSVEGCLMPRLSTVSAGVKGLERRQSVELPPVPFPPPQEFGGFLTFSAPGRLRQQMMGKDLFFRNWGFFYIICNEDSLLFLHLLKRNLTLPILWKNGDSHLEEVQANFSVHR